MEHLDVFTIFMAGASIGVIAGHWLGTKQSKLEYERGRMDAFWQVWCHLVKHELGIGSKSSGHATDGGRNNADKAA